MQPSDEKSTFSGKSFRLTEEKNTQQEQAQPQSLLRTFAVGLAVVTISRIAASFFNSRSPQPPTPAENLDYSKALQRPNAAGEYTPSAEYAEHAKGRNVSSSAGCWG